MWCLRIVCWITIAEDTYTHVECRHYQRHHHGHYHTDCRRLDSMTYSFPTNILEVFRLAVLGFVSNVAGIL